MIEFTLVLTVDKTHLNELNYTFDTYIRYKKELTTCPILVVYDTVQLTQQDLLNSRIGKESRVEYFPWEIPDNIYASQREKMLTAASVVPALAVKTEWFLKLDTDVFAINNNSWIKEEWFSDDVKFVSNSWGYTKPANAIDILDDWADNIDGLKEYPRLNFHAQPGANRVVHKRISSWIFFCNTNYAKEVAGFLTVVDNKYWKMPIPSQDTYYYYCAARKRYKYNRIKFKNFGWQHKSNIVKHLGENRF